jgi:hypothetical protein
MQRGGRVNLDKDNLFRSGKSVSAMPIVAIDSTLFILG